MIILKDDSDIERVIRLLKRMVDWEGIRKSLKRHEYFLRPAERKRQKHLTHLKEINKWERRRMEKERV